MLRYRSFTSKGPLSYEPSIHTNQCVPTGSAQAINPGIYRHCLSFILWFYFILCCLKQSVLSQSFPIYSLRFYVARPLPWSEAFRHWTICWVSPFARGHSPQRSLPVAESESSKRKKIGFRISFQRRYSVSPGRFLTALSRETMGFLWSQCTGPLFHAFFLTHDSNANSLKGSQCLMLVRQGGHWLQMKSKKSTYNSGQTFLQNM